MKSGGQRVREIPKQIQTNSSPLARVRACGTDVLGVRLTSVRSQNNDRPAHHPIETQSGHIFPLPTTRGPASHRVLARPPRQCVFQHIRSRNRSPGSPARPGFAEARAGRRRKRYGAWDRGDDRRPARASLPRRLRARRLMRRPRPDDQRQDARNRGAQSASGVEGTRRAPPGANLNSPPKKRLLGDETTGGRRDSCSILEPHTGDPRERAWTIHHRSRARWR